MSDINLPPLGDAARTAGDYARDLVERVVSTFLQAFLGGVVVSQPFDLGMWHAAALAGVAAAVSLVKGLAARVRSVTNSASLAKGV
jgi:methyl coenzyme M reductase beta subunit